MGKIVFAGEGQTVQTNETTITGKQPWSFPVEAYDEIEWTGDEINGYLEVIKEDKDNDDKKLKGVSIKIEGPNGESKTEVTNKKGLVRYDNLTVGKWHISEIDNPNYGYDKTAQADVTIRGGKPLTYHLKNKKQTGNLKITKEDEATGKKLEGFGFKLKSLDGDIEGNNKGKYIIAGGSSAEGTTYITKLGYTDNIDEATEFKTDANGVIEIYNLIIGNYEVIETSVGKYGYVTEGDDIGKYISWNIQTGVGEYTQGNGNSVVVNVVRRKSFNTEKYNPQKNPLRTEQSASSISTKLQPVNKKKYVKISGYVWLEKPQGKTLTMDDIFQGGEGSDLLFNGIEVRLINTQTGEIVKDKDGNEMRQKTAKLDRYIEFGNNGNGEYLFEDVLIEELDSYSVQFEYDGLTYTNVLCPESNQINKFQNKYSKEEERIENESFSEGTRTSKAIEGVETRKKFNEDFSVVEGASKTTGITRNPQGQQVHDLEYEVKEIETAQEGQPQAQHAIATLISHGKDIVGDGCITQNPAGQEKYPIVAETQQTGYNIERNYDYEPDTEEIRFINLGLTEREQPNMSIAKDLFNVKVEVNGKTHVYDYAQRFNNAGFTSDFLKNYDGEFYSKEGEEYKVDPNGDYIKYEDQYILKSQLIFNVGVRYGIQQLNDKSYDKMTYRRPVYRSDYEYVNSEDPSKELKVYITYKIKLNMEEGNLRAQINELADYYDATYYPGEGADINDFVKVGTKLNDEKNPESEEGKEIGATLDDTYSSKNGKYRKMILDTKKLGQIGEQKDLTDDNGSLYVQFKLSREMVEKILTHKDEQDNGEDILHNVVEINSYSIYDKDGNIYAGIDKNSNPGNADPEERKTYEDDTDSSPSIKLETADAREMSGKVFEDNIIRPDGLEAQKQTSDIMTGYQRKGNGLYENGETGIGGIEVTLEEDKKIYKTITIGTRDGNGVAGGADKYGFIKTENGDEVTYTPEIYDASKQNQYEYVYDKANHNDIKLEDGDFFIKGYIPGENYTLTYTWGDKKYNVQQSEKYTVQDYKGTIYTDETRQNNELWWHEDKFENGQLKQEYFKDGKLLPANANQVVRRSDAMDNYEEEQDAPKGSRKQIDAEMKTVNTAEVGDLARNKMDSKTPRMDLTVEYDKAFTASSGDSYVYLIDNLDFGIVERPRQQMEIEKRVSHVKIILANGQVIVDTDVENGNLPGLHNGVTAGGASDVSIGFVRAEIDNELIQGAKIEIEYTIKVKNKGEVDYDSENYYRYGKEEGNIVKMQADVYDYLDSEMDLTDENPENWKEVENYTDRIQYETIVSKKEVVDTMLESFFKEGTEQQPDGSIKYVYEMGQDITTKLIEEWYTRVTQTKTVRQVKLDGKKVFEKEELKEALAPGNEHVVKLNASKILSNTEEIDLNNDVEITDITREQETGTVPKIVTSHIYDRAEVVTVTPPTGENQNYMLPIIIAVTACIVLGGGVFIIKKKILSDK